MLYVSSLLSIPTILLKVVTDIVDGERPTSDEYLENLTCASLVLHETSLQILHFLEGKAHSDL